MMRRAILVVLGFLFISSHVEPRLTGRSERARLRKCVGKTFRLFHLNKYCDTNTNLLATILEEDMLLGDLDSLQERFGDKLTKSQSLVPMLTQIRKSLFQKHPLVANFLCQALDGNLIQKVYDENVNAMIERMVHHTFLLELITNEMVKDWTFMVELQDHLLAKREALGLPTDFTDFVVFVESLTGQAFEAIKTATLDFSFTRFISLRERGEFLPGEIDGWISSLTFNILEASVAENLNGFNDNAMAGIALVINPAEDVRMVGDRRFIEYELSQEWVSLYESWNLAFITGNVQYLNLLYPKLLLPAVIDAEPDDYIFNRALSLWLSTNFFLFAQITGKPDLSIPNRELLTQLWGEINLKAAEELVLKNLAVPFSNFAGLLGTTYGMLWQELSARLVAGGVISPEEAAELAALVSNGS